MNRKIVSTKVYDGYASPLNAIKAQITDIYARKSLSDAGIATFSSQLRNAGMTDLFVSRFELATKRLSLARSWAHKDAAWKGEVVFMYPFLTGDHKTLTVLASGLLKFAITFPSSVLSAFNVEPAFIIGSFGISTLVFGSHIYNYYMDDHIKCVNQLDSITRLSRAYIDTDGKMPLNYELLSRIKLFNQETGWNIRFTDSTYLLADAHKPSKTLTLSLGWVVDSPYNSSFNRADYENYKKALRRGEKYKISKGGRRYGLDQHRFSQLGYILRTVSTALS